MTSIGSRFLVTFFFNNQFFEPSREGTSLRPPFLILICFVLFFMFFLGRGFLFWILLIWWGFFLFLFFFGVFRLFDFGTFFCSLHWMLLGHTCALKHTGKAGEEKL